MFIPSHLNLCAVRLYNFDQSTNLTCVKAIGISQPHVGIQSKLGIGIRSRDMNMDWLARCSFVRKEMKTHTLKAKYNRHQVPSNRAFTTLPSCVRRIALPISSSSTGLPISLSQKA